MTTQAFRLDPVLPEPAAGQRARLIARAALAQIAPGTADGGAIFRNRELIEALHPLRRHPALGVHCRCGYRMAWIALDMSSTYMMSGNRRSRWRYGGMYDLADITPAPTGGRKYHGWVEDAMAGLGSVFFTGERPGVFSGFTERRTHVCRRCARRTARGRKSQHQYTHNNTELLRLWLLAIANGDDRIRLQ